MRRLCLLAMLLVCACSTTGEPPAFAPNQVWRLRDPAFAEAKVIIGAVEPRGDRTVVHASVVGLPAPEATAHFFSELAQQDEGGESGQSPRRFLIGGAFGEEDEWLLPIVDLSISPDDPDGSIAVPHIAVYQEELRESLSRLEVAGGRPHEMYEDDVKLWRDVERRWPDLNDKNLDRSFTQSLAMVTHGVASVISDETLMSRMGPPPPASAAPGEAPIDDPALDARCREIVDPGPLAPEFIADLLEHGFTREEIPEINVTLSNVTITSSEKWGHIWRADAVDEHEPPQRSEGRSVCWRKDADEQPAVTPYPLASRPESAEGDR
jgi:hypothetical protein